MYKQEMLKRLATEIEDTGETPAILLNNLNPKREALAMAARYLREHQTEVWAQYHRSPQVQMIYDEYYEVIHGIEMEIVELDKQQEGGQE